MVLDWCWNLATYLTSACLEKCLAIWTGLYNLEGGQEKKKTLALMGLCKTNSYFAHSYILIYRSERASSYYLSRGDLFSVECRHFRLKCSKWHIAYQGRNKDRGVFEGMAHVLLIILVVNMVGMVWLSFSPSPNSYHHNDN